MAAPKKLTLSPTKISAWMRCPRFYWFLYVKKYKRRPHGALSLGASLHRSMEIVHAGPERPDIEELLVQFQQSWSGAGFATAEEERAGFAAGQEMLRRYVSEAPPPGEVPQVILQEKMLRQDRGHYILTGRIDRLDEFADGTLDIVDYKSGRSGVTEEQVRADVGLMAYETMVRHHFPGRPVRVAIHALRPNIRVTVLRTPEESAAVAELLDDVARAIAGEAAFQGVNIESTCVGCDFESWCPDWKH
ncbi:MAG TPA: PD-(D/E)XK nuclease family protein [Armatimonadota bacterium]